MTATMTRIEAYGARWILRNLAATSLLMATASASPAMAQESRFMIESAAFAQGGTIPRAHTCTGADTSPPMSWKGVPASAKAIAMVVDDPDAPSGTWVHWVIFDVPADLTRLDEGVPKTADLPSRARQGVNDFGRLGYNGPCPPPGPPHHYHFRMFALDSRLDLPANATAAQLEAAIKGHVVATGELVGTFGR